ncbi:hypothetical protein [Haloferula sargassicola]|uniref:Uncharacterized protein n=1 Tax=Haloferula sargassicola TaxID=490096 RepID=A0ABP9UN64_9BACT
MPNLPLPFKVSDFPSALWILLGLIVFLQIVGILQRLALGSRLKRLQRQLGSRRSESKTDAATPAAAGTEQAGLFEEYLDEDPQRKLLSKKEQFDGFRKWRSEKGLNWSK